MILLRTILIMVFILFINYIEMHTLKRGILNIKNPVNAVYDFTHSLVNPIIKNYIYDKVYFVLYSKGNTSETVYQLKNYTKPNIDLSDTTKVLIHGWRNNRSSGMPQTFKNAYFNATGITNVIIVDWGELSDTLLYPIPAHGVPTVGQCVAEFLMKLYENESDSYLNVHIIGHSLGAHVAGWAGRTIKKKNYSLRRITGLDPALPGIIDGLSQDDAKFVDIIHTTVGALGKLLPLGHVDFYPNGGTKLQPNCSIINPLLCSHSVAWMYFRETIVNPKRYMSFRCQSLTETFLINCTQKEYMGEAVPESTRGTFFLTTDVFNFSLSSITSSIKLI